jgi:hypothetical protein
VSVEITIKQDVPGLLCLFHQLHGGMIFGANLLAGLDPLPVQVKARQAAPVVANDNAVRVKHWNNLEYEVVSKVPGAFILRNEVLQRPLDHEACIGLPWVHT